MPARPKASATTGTSARLGGRGVRRFDFDKGYGCGSGPDKSGFFQAEKFFESHGGKLGDISIYGQDKWARRERPFGLATRARRVRLLRQQPKQSNATARRLAIMNLAIRGIEADIGKEHADTFRRDLHPELTALF